MHKVRVLCADPFGVRLQQDPPRPSSPPGCSAAPLGSMEPGGGRLPVQVLGENEALQQFFSGELVHIRTSADRTTRWGLTASLRWLHVSMRMKWPMRVPQNIIEVLVVLRVVHQGRVVLLRGLLDNVGLKFHLMLQGRQRKSHIH